MRIALSYRPSSFDGWGVEALNMMLYWPDEVVCCFPDQGSILRDGDPRQPRLHKQLDASSRFISSLQSRGTNVEIDDPLFVSLGNDLVYGPKLDGRVVKGHPTIAFPYIEDVTAAERCKDALTSYDQIVCASHFNLDLIKSWGYSPILLHQGVDTVLFNPFIRSRRPDGRFRVFSGGKAEHRKGQDIVVQAFSIFAQQHADALLVAAWSSPWPGFAFSFSKSPIGMPPGSNIGMPNFQAWVQSAGIPLNQFELVQKIPNCIMNEIYSPIDVALFPNRIEGGTNQVAMECVACGIPTIISDCTGHSTLVQEVPSLTRTSLDVEEIVARLEAAYTSPPSPPELPDCFSWPYRVDRLSHLLENRG